MASWSASRDERRWNTSRLSFCTADDRSGGLDVDPIGARQLLLEGAVAVALHQLPLLRVRQADLSLPRWCAADPG